MVSVYRISWGAASGFWPLNIDYLPRSTELRRLIEVSQLPFRTGNSSFDIHDSNGVSMPGSLT